MRPSDAVLRGIGAIGILVGGALHTKLAFEGYGTDDLIRLFFLNGVASALAAAWLVLDDRPLPAVVGAAVAAGSLLAFGLSRVGDGVVGFRGNGLDPAPDAALTVVSELVVVLALGLSALRHRGALRASLPGRPSFR